jgi:hypothetical protein
MMVRGCLVMWTEKNASGANDTRRIKITSGVEYAKQWLAEASVDDLVRVSRLLKHMCRHHETGDAYAWSVEQVRRITGYTDDIPGDYTEFDDALRDGLRKRSKESNELNVCAVYRPGQACCDSLND